MATKRILENSSSISSKATNKIGMIWRQAMVKEKMMLNCAWDCNLSLNVFEYLYLNFSSISKTSHSYLYNMIVKHEKFAF